MRPIRSLFRSYGIYTPCAKRLATVIIVSCFSILAQAAQQMPQPSDDTASVLPEVDARLQVPPADTYAPVWQRAPFAFATKIQPITPPAPVSWISQYDLAYWYKSGQEETIVLADRTTGARMKVRREPNPQGIALVSFEVNPDRSLSKAVLRKNNEIGELRFKAPAQGGANPQNPQNADGSRQPPGTGVSTAETIPGRPLKKPDFGTPGRGGPPPMPDSIYNPRPGSGYPPPNGQRPTGPAGAP
jgi:hypothetical protein